MRKYNKLTTAIAVVLVAPVVVGLAIWLLTQKPVVQADQSIATNVDLPTVEVTAVRFEASARVPRTYSGTIRAARTSELGFNRTGRLSRVLAAQGDRVAANTVLAELDSAALRAQHDELLAQRTGAESLLAELIAGPRQQTVAAARTEVADLEAQQALAKLDFDRRDRLRSSGSISAQEFDEARLLLSSVEQRLQGARLRLAELEEGTRSERIAMQRAELQRLHAAIERTQVDIDESRLVAPYDAVVSLRLFDEGSIVPAGSPMFRLVEQGSREAWIGLPADQAAVLDVDVIYELTIDQQTFAAKLHAVLPELDSVTRTQTAIFYCLPDQPNSPPVGEGTPANDDSALKPASDKSPDQERSRRWCELAPGQLVRLQLEQEVPQSGFWIPVKSLTRGQRGLWSALVVVADTPRPVGIPAEAVTIERRDVEILQVDSDRVLVRGDLHDGESLVRSGTHRLVSGQWVQIASNLKEPQSP